MKVSVPDLGDFADVEIIELLVKAGDRVNAEDSIVTLETEKATMDVPAPAAGVVSEVLVAEGDRVSMGDNLVVLDEESGASDEAPQESQQETEATEPTAPTGPSKKDESASAASDQNSSTSDKAAEKPAPPAAPSSGKSAGASQPVDEERFARVHASPSVRKLARELGVDLGRLSGSGRKGRITPDDIKAYVKNALQGGASAGATGTGLPSLPEVDFAKFGEVETRPLGRIQRLSGAHVHASWVNIPHVTQHDEADVTAMEETRSVLKGPAKDRGIRLTPLAFVIRACALALAEFPDFKSSLSPDGQGQVFKHYTHIGFAADTEHGLVVPVIRDADKKDVYELAQDLAQLSAKARDGKLGPADMQGGVFTVSSLGGIGGSFFTPIVNAPEVAILGVSKSRWQPVYRDGNFEPRLILPLSLSYDHRVIDGAAGVRFTTRLVEILGRIDRLLEAVP